MEICYSWKRKTGKIVREWQDNYVVIDCETTGLDSYFDEIIEFAAARVINGKIVDTYSTLVKPKKEIDSFITSLTGITNEMLSRAPSIKDVIADIASFIGKNVVVGHYVHFDINFLYDDIKHNLNTIFDNDRMDTCFLSKKIYPNLENYKLNTLANEFNLENKPSHRALSDVMTTFSLYEFLKKTSLENNISIKKHKISSSDISVESTDLFDEENIFYDKNVCFTGTLSIPRKEAMQMIANIGGHPVDSVTKECDFLIMGVQDYRKIKDGFKSSKHLKAESLIQKGYDIKILNESLFMESINK